MADLRPEVGGPDRDRGQIILVGAFALAVVFIALALVMNAAIYTENLATRSESAETSNAHAFHRATETAATDAFRYAHSHHSGDHDALNQSVTDAMETYHNATRRQQAAHAQLTNVSVATTPGINVTNDPSDLGNGGTGDWTLVDGVSNTRKFRVGVQSWSGTDSDELWVVAGDHETWYLNVSYNTTTSAYEVGVNDSGSYQSCTNTATLPLTVDVSSGTVGGTSCPALDLGSVSGSYDLKIRNGSVADGKYTMVVDGTPTGELSSSEYENVLYSMSVDLVYWSSDVRYRSTIRVAPGESDG
ncbi:hypothetical protein ACFQMA_03770 [Halosimplex aquaticum]|uniref:Flp pilus-assembly TadG-like N-terminal domain-containing protein n=1 Tax=Halosimplex aquaticum TaxID=3026162 RepID=A0ABD5Y0W6_9EURY|nr:hypothetical protein [Halosimplex aquaticum]